MNSVVPPNESPSLVRQPDEVDRLLGEYFRGAVPRPWPAPPRLADRPVPPRTWRFRAGLRLAVAAAIALALIGYLALAGLFPQTQAPSSLERVAPPIGDNPLRIRTRHGFDAVIYEKRQPGETLPSWMHIRQADSPGKR